MATLLKDYKQLREGDVIPSSDSSDYELQRHFLGKVTKITPEGVFYSNPNSEETYHIVNLDSVIAMRTSAEGKLEELFAGRNVKDLLDAAGREKTKVHDVSL